MKPKFFNRQMILITLLGLAMLGIIAVGLWYMSSHPSDYLRVVPAAVGMAAIVEIVVVLAFMRRWGALQIYKKTTKGSTHFPPPKNYQ